MAFSAYKDSDPGIKVQIENLQMGAGHTVQKSVQIPAFADRVDLQARDGDVRMYAFSQADPTGLNYWILGSGKPESFDGIPLRGLNLYVSGGAATVYLEVRVFGRSS